RVLDRRGHLGRLHLQHRLLERAVTAVGAVGVQGRAGLPEDATQQDGLERGHGGSISSKGPDAQRSRNSASKPSTLSRVTLGRPTSSISTAGAPSHTPMHSTNSTVTLPSALVWPGRTFSFRHTSASTSSPSRRAQASPRQTHSRVFPSLCSWSR